MNATKGRTSRRGVVHLATVRAWSTGVGIGTRCPGCSEPISTKEIACSCALVLRRRLWIGQYRDRALSVLTEIQ
jgi:hypothetical protein